MPILNTVEAGAFCSSSENYKDTVPLPKSWITSKNCFILIVNGQSMFDPDHRHSMTNGDWLVIDTDQKDLRNNAIYVFRRAGEATVKLFIDDGKPILMPLNKYRDVYPIIPAEKNIDIIAKVVQIIPKPTKIS